MNSTCKKSDISMRVRASRENATEKPMPAPGASSIGWRKANRLGADMRSSRVALYLSQADESESYFSALIGCARQARLLGLRVVTIVAEDATAPDERSHGLGGMHLGTLVDRMGDGQFDVIVAHTGHGVITIGGPVSSDRGGLNYGTDDEANNG